MISSFSVSLTTECVRVRVHVRVRVRVRVCNVRNVLSEIRRKRETQRS